MDGLAVFMLLLVSAASALPMMEEGGDNPDQNGDVITDQTPDDVTTAGLQSTEATVTSDDATPSIQLSSNCTTSRNRPGSCVPRVSCEYGTAAIDFTLYAPRGYVKICKMEEVCCPFENVVPERSPKAMNNDDSAFEFDDDD